jgi:hypothetical protein
MQQPGQHQHLDGRHLSMDLAAAVLNLVVMVLADAWHTGDAGQQAGEVGDRLTRQADLRLGHDSAQSATRVVAAGPQATTAGAKAPTIPSWPNPGPAVSPWQDRPTFLASIGTNRRGRFAEALIQTIASRVRQQAGQRAPNRAPPPRRASGPTITRQGVTASAP